MDICWFRAEVARSAAYKLDQFAKMPLFDASHVAAGDAHQRPRLQFLLYAIIFCIDMRFADIQ